MRQNKNLKVKSLISLFILIKCGQIKGKHFHGHEVRDPQDIEVGKILIEDESNVR